VLPLIEDVPSLVERDAYRQRLARLLKVDERSLVGVQKVTRRPLRRISQPAVAVQGATVPTREDGVQLPYKLEAHLLNLFLRLPESLYQVNRILQSESLAPLTINDFENADHVLIAGLVFKALDQDRQDPADFIKTELPEILTQRFQQLVEMDMLVKNIPEERLVEDMVRTIVTLRLIRIREHLSQLLFMVEEDEIAGEDRKEIQVQILQLTMQRGLLDQAFARPITGS
jgi:DNA primase